MKIASAYLLLLITGVYGVNISEADTPTVDRDHHHDEEDLTLTPQENRNGWVNPEDLPSMPQCIAQQDRSAWLSALTKCTAKRCTNHFLFICTQHQWLTELSCLDTAFSPDVMRNYLPYCGRSVLAKAQLYSWIHQVTGRTWLVDVGDTNELQHLSPASLPKGYADLDVIGKAPTCLTGSASAPSREPFQHVIASCGFESTAQHTGNAERPWEYSESRRSMIALDFETAGYDLVGRSIIDSIFGRGIAAGDYFDIDCFCKTFTMDFEKEPCLGSGFMDFTKERFWIHATCGSTSLPDHWSNSLKTTEFAYIPVEDWRWPTCVADMPQHVIELPNQCKTDACEPDSDGYCKVKRAIDRACVCHSISYESCGGSCHVFGHRIDYIQWLNDLCGNVQDWNGLPDNWRQLAVPSVNEMIPWDWTVKPSIDSKSANTRTTETCASNEWKLGSFALVHIYTFLAAALCVRKGIHRMIRGPSWQSRLQSWFSKGALIAALQLLANWFNSFLVQNTSGYERVPVMQLMLLWSSMPRLSWLAILLLGLKPGGDMGSSSAVSLLFAEMILQSLSAWYMILTVSFTMEHISYLEAIKEAERGELALAMYAGALMWLVIFASTIFYLIRTLPRISTWTASGTPNAPKQQRAANVPEDLMAYLHDRFPGLREELAQFWMNKAGNPEQTPLRHNYPGDPPAYGTFSTEGKDYDDFEETLSFLYVPTLITLLLWIAQWLFWGGFIGLSSEEFCPPEFRLLTFVWSAFSVMGVIISVI